MAMTKSQGSAIKEKQSSLVEPRDYGGHGAFVYFMSFMVSWTRWRSKC